MSRPKPPPWQPPYGAASVPTADTLRSTPPGLMPDLGDHDTIAVPLSSADTLPCPRLDMDELPTLRAAPWELAALVALTKPPARPLATTLRPAPMPRRLVRPPDRTPAVRLPDPGPHLPTQLWFAPAAALVRPTQPARRSWWVRLWSLLGFAGRAARRNPARHPGYHRQPIMRR